MGPHGHKLTHTDCEGNRGVCVCVRARTRVGVEVGPEGFHLAKPTQSMWGLPTARLGSTVAMASVYVATTFSGLWWGGGGAAVEPAVGPVGLESPSLQVPPCSAEPVTDGLWQCGTGHVVLVGKRTFMRAVCALWTGLRRYWAEVLFVFSALQGPEDKTLEKGGTAKRL